MKSWPFQTTTELPADFLLGLAGEKQTRQPVLVGKSPGPHIINDIITVHRQNKGYRQRERRQRSEFKLKQKTDGMVKISEREKKGFVEMKDITFRSL